MSLTTRFPPTAARLREGLASLAELAATPLAPTDYLDLFDPLRSRTQLRGRIEAVLPETRDAATVVLRPGRGWQPHRPGQFVRLGVDVDGVRHWRSYSLTSPPRRPDGCLTVTVKAIPDGVVSNHLVRRARPGEIVQLEPAAGDFTLPSTPPAKVLFVTAGSGITPVMGMLRSSLDDLDDVVVVHSAPTPEDSVFRGELRSMAATGGLRFVEQHTRSDGRLDVERLSRLVPDLAERETWACGPTELLEHLEANWEARGFAGRLHVERFRPAVLVAGEGGTVRFARSERTVEVDGAGSLLEAGEDAGVLMPSGCRMGICFGCVTPLRRGAVRDLRTGEVTVAEDGDDVTIQTCITSAAADCELDV